MPRLFLEFVPSSVISRDFAGQLLDETADTNSRYERAQALCSNVIDHDSPQQQRTSVREGQDQWIARTLTNKCLILYK